MTKLERLLRREGLFIGAHRGYSERYPENTLLAVQEGIALGVDLVEVDVYLSRDGVPVIAHDNHLERCSNGTGNTIITPSRSSNSWISASIAALCTRDCICLRWSSF